MQGELDLLRAPLLDPGAYPDSGLTPLHRAAYSADVENVCALLHVGRLLIVFKEIQITHR